MNQWRLIVDEPRPGAWNMAVDEILLQVAVAGQPPTLRFYGWSEPTLSLGYFQRYADRDLHMPSRYCPVVRRTTGGGAILHDYDLTYSLTLPIQDRWSADVARLYREVHHAVASALSVWGVQCHLHGSDCVAGDRASFLCFQRRAEGDVTVGGVKITGSAQRRVRGAVLQQGCLLLRSSPHAPELAGVEDLTGSIVDRRQLGKYWSRELANRFHVAFTECELEKAEIEAVARCVERRFGRADWTQRR